tara:strand:- start:413 stop:586 length:174 start_codon:yes stop_codon:yes gene_type:complete
MTTNKPMEQAIHAAHRNICAMSNERKTVKSKVAKLMHPALMILIAFIVCGIIENVQF